MRDKPIVGRISDGTSASQGFPFRKLFAPAKCDRCDHLRGLLRGAVVAVERVHSQCGRTDQEANGVLSLDYWADLLRRIRKELK